jgi:hypothetical protein
MFLLLLGGLVFVVGVGVVFYMLLRPNSDTSEPDEDDFEEEEEVY